MKAVLGALALSLALAGSALAEDADWLTDDLQESFYNTQTAVVATIKLPQVGTQTIMQTFFGMFDPEPLAVARKAVKDFDGAVQKMVVGYTALADAMTSTTDYDRMTVVGFGAGGGFFSAIDLGPDINDVTFNLAKAAIETVFQTSGFAVSLTRRETYVLIHLPNAGLPAAAHSPEVERIALTGLMQSISAAAVAVSMPTANDAVRTYLTSAWFGTGELGKALLDSEYVGGYLVSGGRPELHVYARFVSKERAEAVKAIYDRIWGEQIAAAIAQDQATEKANEEAKVKGGVIINSYINLETFYRRLQAASEVTLFNNTFMLSLDTADLRQITGAAVDRFYRPAP